MTTPSPSSRLDRARRLRELSEIADGGPLDVLVIGGGITGVGIALDAATRGLSVALVDKHDLAFGTSRWSSKLVHGGLRYLATGHVSLAWESAVERGILMTRTAPHLVRPLPQIIPLLETMSRTESLVVRTGLSAGDMLRVGARTSATVLPRAEYVSPAAVRRYAPTVRTSGMRGGVMSWDGQLVDDARLVVAVARTAALYGAKIVTGVGAYDVDGQSARLHDAETGEDVVVRARAVVNATGVWAAEVDPTIALRPSRGTHLVFDASAFGGLECSLTIPIPGEHNRFVFALPAPLGRVYMGLTDVPVTGAVPDLPVATESEIDTLLSILNTAVDIPLTRADVIGTFAGLRPLLDGEGRTADISREHAVLTNDSGLISVVGGKLTTYRRMAEDAVDAVVRGLGGGENVGGGDRIGPCRTRSIPLVGAGAIGGVGIPQFLIERYGTESEIVVALAESIPHGLDPIADGIDVCAAELEFSVRYEGASSVADLLDRRTRIGLVAADRERCTAAASAVLERCSA